MADPIIVSGSVANYPFHSPATDDKRDNELAMERLNSKIKGSVTLINTLETSLTSQIDTNTANITTNTTNIATNTGNISTNTASIGTLSSSLAAKVDEDATLVDVSIPNGTYTAQLGTQPGGYQSVATLTQSEWNAKGYANWYQSQFDLIEADIAALQSKINEICLIIRG